MRLLRLPDVIAKTGLRPSVIFALVADGKFPKPVAISARARAWLESELDQWIEGRVAERDAKRGAA